MEKRLQCNSETGITVGLIDSLIVIARALVERDMAASEIGEALKDLRACDDMKSLMDVGELSSAKDYIEEQRKTINALTLALELSNSLAKK